MVETWTEREQKHALVEQIQSACAAQQQRAAQFKGKPRDQAPLLDKDHITRVIDAGAVHASSAESQGTALHALIVDKPYPASAKSVHELDPSLTIKCLRLEMRHVDKVLIARRFGPVVTSVVGGTYGMEDTHGNAELLLVDAFNFAGDDILPRNAVFAIKEPFCKVDGNGNARVKLSHPTDLVLLKPTDELVPPQWQIAELAVCGILKQRVAPSITTTEPGPTAPNYQQDFIEVRQTTSAGRGLFSKTSFRLGDQIMAEKAAFLLSPEDRNTYRALKYDVNKNMMTEDPLGAPYKELAVSLLRDPDLAAKVFDLYSGSVSAPCNAQTLIDDRLVIDIFHVHEIWAKNAIACPVVAEDRAFPNRVSANYASASGLWYCAASCNHSCVPNAEKSIRDGTLTLHATREIAEGEEITICYGEYLDQGEKREALDRIWGFACHCVLCKAETSDMPKMLACREALRTHISAPLPVYVQVGMISDSESLVADVEATYAQYIANHLPRYVLAEALSRLLAIHLKLFDYDAAGSTLERMLEALGLLELKPTGEIVCLGGNLEEATVVNVLLLANLHKEMERSVVSQALQELAQKIYLVLNGDMSGFDKIVVPPLSAGDDRRDAAEE